MQDETYSISRITCNYIFFLALQFLEDAFSNIQCHVHVFHYIVYCSFLFPDTL